MIEFARQVNATHHLTLNCHDWLPLDVAVSRLRTWYHFVMRRLFSEKWIDMPREQLIEFVAFPEFSLAGHAHFHCAVRVPPRYLTAFAKLADSRWKAVVPSGTTYLQLIGDSNADRDRLLRYQTKSASAGDVIHSSMLIPIHDAVDARSLIDERRRRRGSR